MAQRHGGPSDPTVSIPVQTEVCTQRPRRFKTEHQLLPRDSGSVRVSPESTQSRPSSLWSWAQEEDPWKLEKERQYFYSIIISALFNSCFLITLIISISAILQLLSCVRLFATPWNAAHQASLSFTVSRSVLKHMSTESVMPSNHLILCLPLLLLCPQPFPASGSFSNKSVLRIRWPKYWGFSFSISPSNEYSRLISFRIDWFDLLTVQGTPKSLLQYHSSRASILWCSAFFMVQLLHSYTTSGKTIA